MSLLTAVTTNAPSKPTVAISIATENNWLCQTFGLSSAGTDDFYSVARSQHQAKRFHLAVKCLEIYIARVAREQAQAGKQAQAVSAASLRPNGKIVGSTFTSFSTPNSLAPNASTTGGLQHSHSGSSNTNANASKSLPVAPIHLLGFCHYGAGDLSKARECFLACVRLGYEADWQMLVQIEHELSEALRVAAGREARAGKDAVATLRKHLAQNQRMREGKDIDEPEAAGGEEDTQSGPPGDDESNADGTTTGNQSEQDSSEENTNGDEEEEEVDPDQQSASSSNEAAAEDAASASSDESEDGEHQQQAALNSIRGSLQQFEIATQAEQKEEEEDTSPASP